MKRKSLTPTQRVKIFLAADDAEYLCRLLAKCSPEPNSGCWLWTGSATDKGYGHMWFKGKYVKSHRISYMLHCGAIPDGHVVCHSCDVPYCINPDHLFVGTTKDNIHDCINKGRAKRGRVGRPKLSREQVSEIRSGPKHYGSGIKLARKYGVTQATICEIRAGRSWSKP